MLNESAESAQNPTKARENAAQRSQTQKASPNLKTGVRKDSWVRIPPPPLTKSAGSRIVREPSASAEPDAASPPFKVALPTRAPIPAPERLKTPTPRR